jgi:hypothetical protein
MSLPFGWLAMALSIGLICCGGKSGEVVVGSGGGPSAQAGSAGAHSAGATSGAAGSVATPPFEDAGAAPGGGAPGVDGGGGGAPGVDGGPCVPLPCPAFDRWDSSTCACLLDPNLCFSAGDCHGLLPEYCLDCADGSTGCAHFTCVGGTPGMCQIADCGDVPPFTLGQECGPGAKYPTCPMKIPCVFDDGGALGRCIPALN